MTAPPAGHQAPQHAAVVGAGIIGSATAYYLSKRGVKVTLIERAGVACAASGGHTVGSALRLQVVQALVSCWRPGTHSQA